jgi:hypothetical protein
VPPAAIEAHLSVIGNPQAMEAALAWDRARAVRHAPVGSTDVRGAIRTTGLDRRGWKGPPTSSPRHTSSPLWLVSAFMLPTK